MAINPKSLIGVYKRPQVVTNEINQSQRPLTTVDGVAVLVPGFSKKGPFNTPIRLQDPQNSINIFGKRDRALEAKGSFFHLTIQNLLSSAPVYALNLLKTDPTRDRVDFKAFSVSSAYDNLNASTIPYENVFDRQDFWERSTQAFTFAAASGNSEQLLFTTNLSDRAVTMWIFKSPLRGYDITASKYFQSLDDLQALPYVHPEDWISDYMVRVLIVNGDWTDYNKLSSDPIWSLYFTKTGLKKNSVDAFRSDSRVNVLETLDCSLIPYFRDRAGNDIFIETLINQRTDNHGIFVALNKDLLTGEPDRGLIDLIGERLIDDTTETVDKNYIKFLSYDEILTEDVLYSNKSLDTVGNVWGVPDPANIPTATNTRTGMMANGYINDLSFNATGLLYTSQLGSAGYYDIDPLIIPPTPAPVAINSSWTFSTGANPYQIYDNKKIDVAGAGFTVPSISGPLKYRLDLVMLNSLGEIYVLQGKERAHNSTETSPAAFETYIMNIVDPANDRYEGAPAITNQDPVLGVILSADYYNNQLNPTLTPGVTDEVNYMRRYLPITIAESVVSFPVLPNFIKPDISYTFAPAGTFQLDFLFTNLRDGVQPRNLRSRRNSFYLNDFLLRINTPDGVLTYGSASGILKYPISNCTFVKDTNTVGQTEITITGPTTLDTGNGNIEALTNPVTNASMLGGLVFYAIDDEIILGKAGIRTKAGNLDILTNLGVIGKKSSIYLDYVNGIINTNDTVTASGTSLQYLVDFETVALNPGVEYRIAFDQAGVYANFAINDRFSIKGATKLGNNSDYLVTAVVADGTLVLDTANVDIPLSNLATSNTFYSTTRWRIGDTVRFNGVTVRTITAVIWDGVRWVMSYDSTKVTITTTVERTFLGHVVVSRETPTAAFEIESNVSVYFFFNFDGLEQTRWLKSYVYNSELVIDWLASSDLVGPGVPFDNPQLVSSQISIIKVISERSNFKQTLEIEKLFSEPNKIGVSISRYGEIQIGEFIWAQIDESVLDIAEGEVGRTLTRVIDKLADPSDPTLMIITTDAPIRIIDLGSTSSSEYQTISFKSLDSYVTTYKGFMMKGFKVHKDSMPDGTQERLDQILDLMAPGTPLFEGLTNFNKIKWRYYVDSFGLGLTANSKQQIADLCGQRLRCLAFLNAPSARQFRLSTTPSFINTDTGALNMEYVAKGGDPSKAAAYRYTLATGKGASNVSYFFPWVTINDRGTPTSVPPASYVARAYLNKFLSRSSSVNFGTIVAGVVNGRVPGITNVEMDFTNTDMDYLSQAAINYLYYEMDIDFVIGTNNTADFNPPSTLSQIHAREVLIELESEMYNMLLRYQFKLNTPQVRREIYTNANAICKKYQDLGVLSAYDNQIDETNNTYEIIDARMAILDTFVEITPGAEILVNNIYVLRSGDLSQGGFRSLE
jgi:hypothetical protein